MPLPDRIEISAPDPQWPAHFERERQALSALPFAAIEHFGSTAIPGLRAKPVIDILAMIPDLSAVAAILPTLAVLGYSALDTGMTGRLFLHKPKDAAQPAVHLHIVPAEGWDTRKERLMRDHLLAHPEWCAPYAALKDDLFTRFADNREAYTQAKTTFLQSLMNAACDERGLPRIDVWSEQQLPASGNQAQSDGFPLAHQPAKICAAISGVSPCHK